MDAFDKVFTTVVIIFALVFSAFIGGDIAKSDMKTEAIKKGHAFYHVDSDMIVTFKWNPPCGKATNTKEPANETRKED